MNIVSICGVGFLCLCSVLVVKENGYKTFSIVIACLCSIMVVVYAIGGISGELSQLIAIIDYSGNIGYSNIVVKSFGIAYISEISADCIRDLGANSIASSIEFAAKIEILILCINPIYEILSASLRLADAAM